MTEHAIPVLGITLSNYYFYRDDVMSILLESLNQSKQSSVNSEDRGVPGVGDSHFDDEILSDEWLLKKVWYWKITSAALLLVLLVSWIGFYFYSPISENKVEHSISKVEENTDVGDLQKQQDNRVGNKEISEAEENVGGSITEVKTNIEEAEVGNIAEKAVSKTKEKYQPKKIEKTSIVTSAEKNITKSRAQQTNLNQNGQVIEFDSLTEIEKQELPELEISSYAVSSNPEKSFVVLNGAFYGQGETISPHLVLISIDKEGILIRYKGRMISKKYSL